MTDVGRFIGSAFAGPDRGVITVRGDIDADTAHDPRAGRCTTRRRVGPPDEHRGQRGPEVRVRCPAGLRPRSRNDRRPNATENDTGWTADARDAPGTTGRYAAPTPQDGHRPRCTADAGGGRTEVSPWVGGEAVVDGSSKAPAFGPTLR